MAQELPFIHLHNHSEYSLLDGACTIPQLLEQATQARMPALALTDHGNLFGATEFYAEAQKAGVRPLVGMEAYISPSPRSAGKRPKDKLYYHLVLIAQNREGYQNLMQLSTIGFLEGFYYKPRIDKSDLRAHSAGLVALSGCLRGEVPQRLLAGDRDGARAAVREALETFGPQNFYVELQDHGLAQEATLLPELVQLAREFDLPLVATNDIHYLKKAQAQAHDVLLCIQTGKDLEDRGRMRFETQEFYFKSPQEMAATFAELPEALTNTLTLAERCDLSLDLDQIHLPSFPVPPGYRDLDEYLADEARGALRQRYPEVPQEVERRLAYELDIIRQTGYASYFLIVKDFIDTARARGIPVGPGRGSAAGSLVSYCLGITNLDPIKYGLLFERFLNPARVSLPDIDIDFSDERRGEIIQYARERYGRENVAQIITFGRMLARAVVRDVGRVLKVPLGETDRIAKLIPSQPGWNLNLVEALERVPELRELYEAGEDRHHRLIDTALALEGLARHASVHAAGVVITPKPLVHYTPLFKTNKDEITTQYDMKSLERIGLLKIDFLGLTSLTVLDRTLHLVKARHGVEFDLLNLPLEDEPTYRLLGEGKTTGVFQFEGNVPTDVLKRLKPSSFEEIVAVNALIRPGALNSGMTEEFIQRKQGKKAISYPHPSLEPVLKETYGVIIYQEQVMEIASTLAGFSLGQADLLRRAMGKKKPEEMAAMRQAFVDGAAARGVPEARTNEIFDLMDYFAGYGFNKSHSVAYSYLSYATAYLKCHYPAEFVAALLTSEMGNADKIVQYIAGCRELGLAVLPPDVNESGFEFTVVENGIRFGLGAIKNVGQKAVESIIAARERHGPFRTLYQFVERIDLRLNNKRVVESLIQAGALDSLEGHRAQLLAGLDQALTQAQRRRGEREMGQMGLFGTGGKAVEAEGANPPLPETPPWSTAQKLAMEKSLLGFYVSGHPLDPYRLLLSLLTTATTESFRARPNGGEVILGGILTVSRRLIDRKGNEMAFLTLEDSHGTVEVIAFNDAFQQYRHLCLPETIVLVRGTPSPRDREEPRLVLKKMWALADLQSQQALGLVLQLSASQLDPDRLLAIKDVLKAHPGPYPVFVAYRNGPSAVRLRSRGFKAALTPELVAALKTVVGEENLRAVCLEK